MQNLCVDTMLNCSLRRVASFFQNEAIFVQLDELDKIPLQWIGFNNSLTQAQKNSSVVWLKYLTAKQATWVQFLVKTKFFGNSFLFNSSN